MCDPKGMGIEYVSDDPSPLPVVDTWRPPRQVPAPGQEAKPTVPLDQAREDLSACMKSHFRAGRPGMIIFRPVPGVGKTTAAHRAAEEVARETGKHIAWFGTRHNQFDAVERSPGWVHVEGRHGNAYDAEGNLVKQGNCRLAQAAQTIGRKGLSVSHLLCGPTKPGRHGAPTHYRCHLNRSECPWWRQWEGNAHRYMPSQHLAAADLWNRPDLLLVFDELDAKDFTPEPVYLDLNTIGKWRAALPIVSEVFTTLLDFVSEPRDGFLADAPLYQELSKVLPDLPGIVLETLSLPGDDDGDPSNLDTWADELPDGHVVEFLKTLYQERDRYRNDEQFVSRVAVCHDRMIYYPPPKVPPAVFKHPAVLLNASADVEALKFMPHKYQYALQVYAPNVALHPDREVHYILDANHSKSTVERQGERYGKRWVKRIRDALATSKRALVVATMAGEGLLSVALADLVDAGRVVLVHYGAVSGLNDYQTCDTVVLAQPFNPPPHAVAGLYRRIYGGTPGEPLDLTTCYRTVTLPWSDDEGMTWEVTVSSMRDERLAPLYERWRWAEMYQAAHRVRPLLNKRRIVVTCAIPLANLEPTAVSYSNRKDRTMDKLREAARRLIQEQGHFSRQDLAHEAGVSRTTVGRYWCDLIESENLRIIEIAVPSERYPGGRMSEAAAA